MMFKIYH